MRNQWTTAQLPRLDNARVVITGANSGLGYETARALAATGASVTLACRDTGRAEQAAQRIHAGQADAQLEVRELDLADLGSVYRFAEDYARDHDSLDLLINNAGVMALPRRETRDGFEMQFGTNHLGHFALTGRLFPLLLQLRGARVITVSSLAHRFGTIRLHDLNWRQGYRKWAAYGQAKLANLMFALELDRRLRGRGIDMLSLAAHPGYAATNLQFAGPAMRGSTLSTLFMRVGNSLLAQSQYAGAMPILCAATAEQVAGGDYYGPSGLLEIRGLPHKVSYASAAADKETARQLWDASE